MHQLTVEDNEYHIFDEEGHEGYGESAVTALVDYYESVVDAPFIMYFELSRYVYMFYKGDFFAFCREYKPYLLAGRIVGFYEYH